jgi:hypothetical protein
MEQAGRIRFPKWLRLTVAIVGGLGAALACMVYVANGIVAGSIIGLPGREHDIAVAQHQSQLGLLSCVLLQIWVAGALFSYMDQERYQVARIVWAVVLSFVLTGACGVALLCVIRAFR